MVILLGNELKRRSFWRNDLSQTVMLPKRQESFNLLIPSLLCPRRLFIKVIWDKNGSLYCLFSTNYFRRKKKIVYCNGSRDLKALIMFIFIGFEVLGLSSKAQTPVLPPSFPHALSSTSGTRPTTTTLTTPPLMRLNNTQLFYCIIWSS